MHQKRNNCLELIKETRKKEEEITGKVFTQASKPKGCSVKFFKLEHRNRGMASLSLKSKDFTFFP